MIVTAWLQVNLELISSFILLPNKYISGLVHDCSFSSVLAMEILQSCTKPSNCHDMNLWQIFLYNMALPTWDPKPDKDPNLKLI